MSRAITATWLLAAYAALATCACGGGAAAPAKSPAAAGSATAPKPGAAADDDCHRLRAHIDEVTTALDAMSEDDAEGASALTARFTSLSTAMRAFEKSLDAAPARADVRALAADYRTTAHAVAAAADGAADVARGAEPALKEGDALSEAWLASVQPVYDLCKAKPTPPDDCRRIEAALVALGESGEQVPAGFGAAHFDAAYDAIGKIKPTTPGLAPKVITMKQALGRLRTWMHGFEGVAQKVKAASDACDESMEKFRGLDERNARICGGRAP